MVEAITDEYYNVNANVHRGVHYLSQQATDCTRKRQGESGAPVHQRAVNKRDNIHARPTSNTSLTISAFFTDSGLMPSPVL